MGATLLMDIWVALRKRVFGVPALDYGLLGRWVGHMAAGRFRHRAIAAAASIRGERAIGWVLHYGTGIGFAALLVLIVGSDWLRNPGLIPAVVMGLASVAAPFFVMQPAFGLGIAASRTPNPNQARLRSVITHLSFGVGLYLAGQATLLLFPS